MKIGRLGVVKLAKSTNIAAYTVPAANTASCSVMVCNIGDYSAKIRLAIVDGAVADLADEDYIEYGVDIPAGGVLERTGLTLSAGETVVAWADKNTIVVRVHGYEEA